MTRKSVFLNLRPTVWAVLFAVMPGGAAHAVRGANTPPPTAAAVRAANPASVQQAAADQAAQPAAALREGRVTAIDSAAGRLDIDGRAYRLADDRTHIYRRGLPAASTALVVGQRVGFALAGPAGAAATPAGGAAMLSIVDVR